MLLNWRKQRKNLQIFGLSRPEGPVKVTYTKQVYSEVLFYGDRMSDCQLGLIFINTGELIQFHDNVDGATRDFHQYRNLLLKFTNSAQLPLNGNLKEKWYVVNDS